VRTPAVPLNGAVHVYQMSLLMAALPAAKHRASF
jgi:hypothetical protein